MRLAVVCVCVGGGCGGQVNGHLGVISRRETSTMTSFFAPAVLGFVSETTDLFRKNRTDFISTRYLDGSGALSAPHQSYGGQQFRIFGMHFGRRDLTRAVRAWYVAGGGVARKEKSQELK